MDSSQWMFKGYRNLPRVIIGLGNPGHHGTPHNAGADLVAYLFRALDAKRFITVPQIGKVAEIRICKRNSSMTYPDYVGGHFGVADIALVQCTLGMEFCGRAVRKCLRRYSIHAPDLLCAHDSIFHDFGTFQFHYAGNARGHAGILSIFEAIEESSFEHVRIGVRSSAEEVKDPEYLVTPIKDEKNKSKLERTFKDIFDTLNILNITQLENSQ